MARAGTYWKALFAVAGAAAVGAVAWVLLAGHPGAAPAAAADGAPAAQAAPAGAEALDSASAPQAPALPASLAGTEAPRLPVDEHGRLTHTRAVRDFFDYFLTAQDSESPRAIDALVRRAIAAQLEGTPAADEALAVWQRYSAYLAASAKLTPPASNASPGKPDLDALQTTLDQRAELATRLMGDWSDAFFGDELHQQRDDLARLRITSDPNLSDAEKRARLAALDAGLPPAERAEREQARAQEATIDSIAQLQKQHVSPDDLRAQVSQTLGPAAAERVVQMQKDEDDWQSRYASYDAQRAQLAQAGLSAQDYATQVASLRQRLFPDSNDALRAAALDQGAGH
ncbi:lipase secretion chaperone [Paraburkholderia antibiotica]|uniref:Lipase chaperone n=1 Tax=Paraburkholderia antibiotica TaxID=2728839 RepID=A0A7Y0A0D2_9BURK|nr:lipase secretion chaperone [Paraburkholderia antibiotica]NML34165.1 lipase secretion chaperone [Paraburkholderia antibiotica]